MKQADKLALCQIHEEILYYIGVINKGYILRQQLEEYCLLFATTIDTKYAFEKALKELQKGDIIKQINFMDTSNNIVMLKKFGIAYLKGLAENYNSQKVGAIKTCTSNERYLRSIMINEYILNNARNKEPIKSKMRKLGLENFFRNNNFNIFMKTDEYCSLLEQKFSEYIELDYLKDTKEKYLKEIESKKKATEISRQSRLNKANGIVKEKSETDVKKGSDFGKRNQKQRNKLMREGTIETLKKKGSYLRITPIDKKAVKVSLFYFDYKNQQDRLKMIEHLALTISICNCLFRKDVKIKYEFTGYVCNDIAFKKACEDLKDISKTNNTLNTMYGLINPLNEDNYTVKITNLNITEKYLNQMPVIRLDTEIKKKKERENQLLRMEIEELKKLLKENNIDIPDKKKTKTENKEEPKQEEIVIEEIEEVTDIYC